MRYFEALLFFSKLLGVYQNYTIFDVAAGWRYIHSEKRMHTCKIQILSHISPAFINIAYATIQPLTKLQNKAIKIINPINSGSIEENFQHLNILCLPKLYSFSVGKFMHSYHNKLLPNHFDEYFVPLSSIHYHFTRLATSKNLFLPRVNSSSENVLLNS